MRPARRRESAEPGLSKSQTARKQVSFNSQVERAQTPEAPQPSEYWADVEVRVLSSYMTTNANINPTESPRTGTQARSQHLRLPTLLQAETKHKRKSR
jgi:ribosomal protein S18